MRPGLHEHGYYEVGLCSINQRRHCFKVHRLVALGFIPNPTGAKEVNHKNGDKADNSAGNLEWATRSENILHAFRTGLKTSRHGELCSWAKLTAEDVRAIRQIGRGSRTLVSLAMQFGVSAPTIRSIINRTIWKHAV